jgi:hypothetical protein
MVYKLCLVISGVKEQLVTQNCKIQYRKSLKTFVTKFTVNLQKYEFAYRKKCKIPLT